MFIVEPKKIEFTQEELLALQEQYNDLLKDFPEDSLYQSIINKIEKLLLAK